MSLLATRPAQGSGVLVVTGWAQQLEILVNSTMIAFMSHFG
jgi:hypothetical protein